MRPVIALLITVLLFAGTYAYTQFAESVRRPALVIAPRYASGNYAVRIDRTFGCVGDSEWDDVPSLVIKFRGEEIVRRTDAVSAGEVITIDPLENVEQQENEIYVFANLGNSAGGDGWDDAPATDDWDDEAAGGPGSSASAVANRALRIVVTRGEDSLADKTLWALPGAITIEGTVSFEAPVQNKPAPNHDH